MVRFQENVSLAPYSTLGINAWARFFVQAQTDDKIRATCAYAREHKIPLAVLCSGSNVLVPDGEFPGIVLHVATTGMEIVPKGEKVLLIVSAGELWDAVVRRAGEEGLWGIENLAGIPGTVGAAPVQNIGAYGAQLADVFAWAEVLNCARGGEERITPARAQFGYRTSLFKKERQYIITRVALSLARAPMPRLSYKDLTPFAESMKKSSLTPSAIAKEVRRIRASKFPNKAGEGTAGSFFKNPIVTPDAYHALKERFPGLPGFPSEESVKIPLAWILDRVLGLAGFSRGAVRLYEKQPLILVASAGARAKDVDSFAREIEERVHQATGISIEREVQNFSSLSL